MAAADPEDADGRSVQVGVGDDPATKTRPSGACAHGPQIGIRGRGQPSPVSAARRPAVADDQSSNSAAAVQALERLGALSLRELSMDYLLQTVADLAKTVMPGNPETSVTLVVKDHPTT